MDTYTLVRPGHLNHHGSLFGGQLLQWVDEHAWMAAALDFPHSRLVTRAMDAIEFRHPVPNGAILRFHIQQKHIGNTSVVYTVEVYSDNPGESDSQLVFTTNVTFVSVDDNNSNKRPLIR